jgi:hypothetical protein
MTAGRLVTENEQPFMRHPDIFRLLVDKYEMGSLRERFSLGKVRNLRGIRGLGSSRMAMGRRTAAALRGGQNPKVR